MNLPVLLGQYIGVVGLTVVTGRLLSDLLIAEIQRPLGTMLSEGVRRSLGDWMQVISRAFLQGFDWLYKGRASEEELYIWSGLLWSLVILFMIRMADLANANLHLTTSESLILAMTLAFGLSLAAWIGANPNSRFSGRTKWLVIIVSGILGVLIAIAGIFLVVYGLISAGSRNAVVVGIAIGTASGVASTMSSGASKGVIAGVLFGIVGAVVFDILTNGVTGSASPVGIAGVIVSAIAVAIAIVFGSWLVFRSRFKEFFSLVNPVKAVISSIVFITLVTTIKPITAFSFIESVNNQGFGVLAFVAFNIFGDSISLLETWWILRLGVKATFPELIGLLLLDLLLSAAIFLALPTVLWEIPEFLNAVLYRGQQPWLGTLFWSTFGTSVAFYMFVLSALLVRLLSKVLIVGRFLDVQTKPVLVMTFATVAVITIVFWAQSAEFSCTGY